MSFSFLAWTIATSSQIWLMGKVLFLNWCLNFFLTASIACLWNFCCHHLYSISCIIIINHINYEYSISFWFYLVTLKCLPLHSVAVLLLHFGGMCAILLCHHHTKASSYLASKAVLSLCRLVQNQLPDGAQMASSLLPLHVYFSTLPLLYSFPSVNFHSFIYVWSLILFF